MRKSCKFAVGKSLPFGEVGGALLFYRYDASGERDLKLVGQPMEMWQNGQHKNIAVYDQATLYASGLMTVSEKGYTKHYFAEGERIASSIGGGGIPSVGTWDEVPVIMGDYGSILENYDNFVADYFVNNWFNTLPAYEDADDAYGGAWWEDPQFEILRVFFDENGFPYELWYEGTLKDVFPYLLEQRYGIPAQKIENKTLSEIVEYLYSDWGEDLNVPVLRGAEWQGGSLADDYNYYINRSDPDELYYFHSDHLGSGSVITNGNSGDAYQTLAYAPFGELLINLRNGLYDEPYKFTGYERDEETGFDYAHARYYWSNLGIFTSADPLAEKYPHLSGYAYCANNPTRYVDPDGRFLENPSSVKTARFAVFNPVKAFRIGEYKSGSNNISTVAGNFGINLTKAMGLEVPGEGNYNNAIRHVTWQALITKEFDKSTAIEVGNAHESEVSTVNWDKRYFGKDMSSADKMIDLLNNQIGREIGEKNPHASNQEIAAKVIDEFATNGLWTATKDSRGDITIEKTLLNKEQYDAARKRLSELGENGLTKKTNSNEN